MDLEAKGALYIYQEMGGSHGMLVSGCSLQALKHGAAANNIRGRSLKIELMQQWRPFHSCRMRITVGGQERRYHSAVAAYSRKRGTHGSAMGRWHGFSGYIPVASCGLPLRRMIRTLPIKATLTCLPRAVNERLGEATLWLIMISLSCTWISITSHPPWLQIRLYTFPSLVSKV
ncbi:conserved hypothetical protein [Coccidioides posadasii str. Silveira]|uniref:Uncharacterized protein n=1 Tax=Coccidioides posadasii (strain RMSCC 757 / Silveira) TaxID=443226 RepID=E9D3B9_COCPS|nr:conserved hypothetical protein [Coccidioides posadasii str. Silveira]